MKSLIVPILALGVSVGSMTAKAVPMELVTNGGFETGDLSGWSCTGATFCDAQGGGGHTGTYQALLREPLGQGTLAQDLTTIVGETYDLSLFSRVVSSPATLSVEIGTLPTIAVTPTLTYSETISTFVANATTTPLRIKFYAGTQYWNVDDVSVTTGAAVPAPATFALMVLGLAGIGYRRYKTVYKQLV